MSNQPPIRPTGTERDHTVEILGRAFADGSISQREYEERLRTAQRSVSKAELDGLTADLPDEYRRGLRTKPASRRTFLKVGASAVAAVALIGGGYFAGQSRVDNPTSAISTNSTESTIEQDVESPTEVPVKQEPAATATATESATAAPTATTAPTATPYPTPTPTPSVPNETGAFEHVVGYEPARLGDSIEEVGSMSMGGYELSKAVSWGKKQSYFDETVEVNLEFSTGRKYDCFSALLGLSDDSDPEESMLFSIHLDGELYEERNLDKYSPWFVQIDGIAQDVGLIRIDWGVKSDLKGYGVIGDPKFFLTCPS